MKTCANCGASVEDDELFCGECGVKQETEQEKEKVAETVIWTGNDTASDTGADTISNTDTISGADTISGTEAASETASETLSLTASDTDTVKETDKNTEYLYKQEPSPETEEFLFCSQCGSKNSAGDLFCMNCGANLNGEEASTPNPPVKMVFNKKIIVGIGAAAVIAIAAIGVNVLGVISGGTSEKLVYSKDNSNIQYVIKNKKSLEITDRASENKEVYEIVNSLEKICYSEDGKYVFYSEKEDSDGVGTLMYKNLRKQGSKKDTSEKLDSNVSWFRLLSSGKVLYLKGSFDESNLYLSDLKDKTKIGSGIRDIVVSEDESSMIFMTNDNEIYTYDLKNKNASKDKLESEASYIICTSKDLKYIYYAKDERLMCIKDLKDKEKIASDFTGNWAYAEGGKSIYYMLPGEEHQYADFVTDDLAMEDSNMQYPSQNDYRVANGTDWFGYTTYTVDTDRYNSAVDAYDKKLQRDEIRNRLDNLGSISLKELYLYDGKESTKISDTVLDLEAETYSDKGSTDKVICVSQVNLEELGAYDLASVDLASDVSDKLLNGLEESKKYYLVTNTVMNEFDVDEYISFSEFDLDNDTFYYSDDLQEDGSSTLHAISYNDNSIKSPEKIADAVSGVMLFNGKIGYWSDFDDGEATLNISGEEIDDDVSMYGLTPVSPKEDDSIYYAKDYSERDESFTLYRYQNGKSVKIDDDIILFKPLEAGKVAYLQDYSLDKFRGDLWIWASEKKQDKIDDDVSYIKGGYSRGGNMEDYDYGYGYID